MKIHNLVLLRHGESQWNKENRFTGWQDVSLSEKGVEEAIKAGKIMKKEGLVFDEAHTSLLKRAIKTEWLALEEIDLMWIPEFKSWRLNERHYGDLQGYNKAEMAVRVGEEQVQIWRRSFDVPPPALKSDDHRYPGNDPRYSHLTSEELPLSESLKDTIARVLPYWNEILAPAISSGKTILVTAHGNSLRALVKYLDNISDQDIIDLNIPTGVPLLYQLDENLKPISRKYLGDREEIERAAQAVANQGKKNN